MTLKRQNLMLHSVIISVAGDIEYLCLVADLLDIISIYETVIIEMKPIKIFSAIFMVLVLTACAQTTATKTESPKEEKPRPTSPTGSPASPESAESGQPATQTKPKPGEAASAGETATQTKETDSPSATESGLQQSTEKQANEQATAGESAETKLEEARENLRISRETEKRIAAELEQLKESGNASEEAVRDYETYLKSVAAMTAENRKIVEQMEAAYAGKSSGKTGSNELDKMADPDIPEEQATDEVAVLDRQLNASLAKFDGMLLKEMDEIRAGSSEKLQDLAAEAAEAAKRLREKGLDVDTSGSKSSDGSQEDQEDSQADDRKKESTAGRKGSETASRDGSRKGGEGPSSTDQRRRDYEDDDIVARQLREAAENETDPELKEKLWKEYEEYKKSN